MANARDESALKRALKGYSPKGYRVNVPVIGSGVIEEQIAGTAGPAALFRVRADSPVTFDEYAQRINASDKKLSREEIESMWAGRTLPFEEETLKRGLSKKDIAFQNLMQTGCLDVDQNVACVLAPWSLTRLEDPKKGTLVEYSENGMAPKVWAGKVAGLQDGGDVVLLEMFEPIPYMRVPENVVPEAIKKGFYSSNAWALGYGLHEALEDAGVKIPPGAWSEDNQEFLLKEPMPFEEIEAFCTREHPEEPHCKWFGMTMFVVPVRAHGSGVFHPLREDTTDYYVEALEVSYE